MWGWYVNHLFAQHQNCQSSKTTEKCSSVWCNILFLFFFFSCCNTWTLVQCEGKNQHKKKTRSRLLPDRYTQESCYETPLLSFIFRQIPMADFTVCSHESGLNHWLCTSVIIGSKVSGHPLLGLGAGFWPSWWKFGCKSQTAI